MWLRKQLQISETERCYLRLPEFKDYADWVNLRKESEKFLAKWEPERVSNYYSIGMFKARVKWSKLKYKEKKVVHVFIFKKYGDRLIGAITLDNIKYGATQSCSVGYWIAEKYSKKGYMSEALKSLVFYAFSELKLSRIEAATLPENSASRRLLEKLGFKYEGVAQSYLEIAGRWRNHVMYGLLREDRRGLGKNFNDL